MNKPAPPRLPGLALAFARLRHGRPLALAGRVLTAVVLAEIVLHAGAGPAPQAGGLAGIITWLALAIRGDIAPPPGR